MSEALRINLTYARPQLTHDLFGIHVMQSIFIQLIPRKHSVTGGTTPWVGRKKIAEQSKSRARLENGDGLCQWMRERKLIHFFLSRAHKYMHACVANMLPTGSWISMHL